jgi:hypothetical protein
MGVGSSSISIVISLVMSVVFSPSFIYDRENHFFIAKLNSPPSLVKNCIKGGLDLRARYEVQTCKINRLWFDECFKSRIATRQLKSDAITQEINLVSDIHADSRQPNKKRLKSYFQALEIVTSSPKIALNTVEGGKDLLLNSPKSYLRYRITYFCEQDYSRTLDSIAKVLSLGLIGFPSYDSGWLEIHPSTVYGELQK